MDFYEFFRQSLPKDQKIAAREAGFEAADPERKEWRQRHTYLCSGGIDELRRGKNYKGLPEEKIIYYPTPNRARPKKIVIQAREPRDSLVEKLKDEIFMRGCNAGIFFRAYEKGANLVVEAVPILVTCE